MKSFKKTLITLLCGPCLAVVLTQATVANDTTSPMLIDPAGEPTGEARIGLPESFDEPIYLIESSEDTVIEMPQSDYHHLYELIQSAVREVLDASVAERGEPSVTEDPVYQAIAELCRNPTQCTQANIDRIQFSNEIYLPAEEPILPSDKLPVN